MLLERAYKDIPVVFRSCDGPYGTIILRRSVAVESCQLASRIHEGPTEAEFLRLGFNTPQSDSLGVARALRS